MQEHPYARTSRLLFGSAFAAIRYVEETGSTNADAAELLGDATFGGTTLVAEHQRRGTGRKGRSWLAPAGTSLLFTTVLPRDVATEHLWAVPFWAALCVGSALRANGIATTLVWPNDLLLDDRKLAGILCVSRITGERARVACGVGINVRRWPAAEKVIDPPPAFCDDVRPLERPALLHDVLAEYQRRLPQLDDTAAVAREWQDLAGVPGRNYRILRDGEPRPFNGVAMELANGGGLLLRKDDGTQTLVALADARALR